MGVRARVAVRVCKVLSVLVDKSRSGDWGVCFAVVVAVAFVFAFAFAFNSSSKERNLPQARN